MYKFLYGGLLSFSLLACGTEAGQSGPDEAATDDAATMAAETKPAVEILDAKYIEMGRNVLKTFASENIDAFMAYFTDDARYYFSGGDSLIGKEAISNYWKDRFANAIESVTVNQQIWLPVRVNQAQATEQPGNWLLGWIQVNAKYKTGKEITFWVHQDHHLNANDKIDQTITYLDRVPIQAASTN